MENESLNGGDGGDKSSNTNTTTATTEFEEEQNPNSTSTTTTEEVAAAVPITRQSSRTPFTNLSQVDADLALARTLQEQERAFMMLSTNNVGSDYGSWETGSFNDEDVDDHNDDDHDDDVDVDEDEGEDEDIDDENDYEDDDEDEDDDDDEEVEGDDDDEDAFDVHAHEDIGDDNILSVEIDPSAYPDDEAYARALQDAEERELASRLLAFAGLNDRQVEDVDDHDDDSQDTWEDVDPDELSYEELIALGDVVGTQSRGLSSATIESLQSVKYKAQENQDGNNDTCVICRLDYEDDDTLTVLSCKHSYHSECINNWLKINKVCPVCNAEVSAASENK